MVPPAQCWPQETVDAEREAVATTLGKRNQTISNMKETATRKKRCTGEGRINPCETAGDNAEVGRRVAWWVQKRADDEQGDNAGEAQLGEEAMEVEVDLAEMRMDAAEESDDAEGENTDEMSVHDPTGVG